MEDVAIEELKCDTVSGSYAMSDSRIEDSLDLDSVSGAVRIENLNCREVGIETVSGSVYISLWGRMNDTDIDISGLFRSEKRDGDGDASLSVSSVSGRVEYHFLED